LVRVRFLRYISGFQGFRVSGFQALTAEALAKAGFQAFNSKFKIQNFKYLKPDSHDKYSNYFIIGCHTKLIKELLKIP